LGDYVVLLILTVTDDELMVRTGASQTVLFIHNSATVFIAKLTSNQSITSKAMQ